MNYNIVGMVWALLVLMAVMYADANPVYYGGYSGAYRGGRRSGGRSYNDIARVLNPSPYANVRGVPFPAQPFWTYSG